MNSLIPFRKKQHWGYCNAKKEIVVECVYDAVQEIGLNNPLLLVKKQQQNHLVNHSGKIIASGFYNFFTGWKEDACVAVVSKVLSTKKIVKGTAAYDDFPKEAGAYYPDVLEIMDCIYGAYDTEGNLLEPFMYKTLEEIKNKLSFKEYNSPVTAAPQTPKLRPRNIPDSSTSSGHRGFYLDADGSRNETFNYEFVFDFFNDIAPVQTGADQWIFINGLNQQVSRRSYLRAFPFQREGIARVVTDFQHCVSVNPGNQSNWTGMPDNLWVPEGATYGFIDTNGTEYWED